LSLPKNGAIAPPVPPSPEPYTWNHPNRIEKFPLEEDKLIRKPSPDSVNRRWRHDLEHDAESVFWLLLYWVVGAQPAQPAQENVTTSTWALLIGSVNERDVLITAISSGRWEQLVAHSFYQPLSPLLQDLATILTVDRYWLDTSETRNNEEYVLEAFQRLVLQFILENRSKEFMTQCVVRRFRKVQEIPQTLSLPITDSSAQNAENIRKRPSPQPSTQRMKRPRVAEGVRDVRDSILWLLFVLTSLCVLRFPLNG
jgi:hypothetical protein